MAVVGDEDALGAAAVELDAHVARARVERVFDQLFDDRRRPLDDLTRGDLGRQVRVHDADRPLALGELLQAEDSVCA